MASPQFDFPDPLGPVMAVNPLSKGMVTSPLNDLKFEISIAFRYIPTTHPEKISDLNGHIGNLEVLNYARDKASITRFQGVNNFAVKAIKLYLSNRIFYNRHLCNMDM